jgi:hypothetical protein
MAFTAKVRKTGELFYATSEWEGNFHRFEEAARLSNGKTYAGRLLVGARPIRETPSVAVYSYTAVRPATFASEDLERISYVHIQVVKDRRPPYSPPSDRLVA